MRRLQFRVTPYLSHEVDRRTGQERAESKTARIMAERYARIVDRCLPFFHASEWRFIVHARIPCESHLDDQEWPAWVAHEAKRDGLPGTINAADFLARLEGLSYIQRVAGHDFCETFWVAHAKGLNPVLPGEARLA